MDENESTLGKIAAALHKVGVKTVISDEHAKYISAKQAAEIIETKIDKKPVIITDLCDQRKRTVQDIPENRRKNQEGETGQKGGHAYGKDHIGSRKRQRYIQRVEGALWNTDRAYACDIR